LLRKHDRTRWPPGSPPAWRSRSRTGRGRRQRFALAAVAQSAKFLERTKADTFAEDDAVVGTARWVAQNHIGQNVTEPTSKLTSDAEHLLLTGNLSAAVSKLTAASKVG
jgi:beta-glucosidase